jgi:hypothetical protein
MRLNISATPLAELTITANTARSSFTQRLCLPLPPLYVSK